MVVADSIEVELGVNNKKFVAVMDDATRRIEKLEDRKSKAGKKDSSFLMGAVGGAAGFVASQVASSGPVGSILEVFSNLLAAIFLPLLMAILPLLKSAAKTVNGLVEDAGKFINSGTNARPGAEPESYDDLRHGGQVVGTVEGAAAGKFSGIPGAPIVGAAVGYVGGTAAGFIEGVRQHALGPNYRAGPAAAMEWQQDQRIKEGKDDRYGNQVDPNEKTHIWVGPIPVPVKRNSLWGPDSSNIA